MATLVSEIFEPRITKIGIGSFLLRIDGVVYFIAVMEGDRLKAINLMQGSYLGVGVVPNSLEHLTRDEFLQLTGHTGFDAWSVLSRAEAAAELAKMK